MYVHIGRYLQQNRLIIIIIIIITWNVNSGKVFMRETQTKIIKQHKTYSIFFTLGFHFHYNCA